MAKIFYTGNPNERSTDAFYQWARENIFSTGISTWSMFENLPTIEYHCYVCFKTDKNKEVTFETLLKHINSDKHQQNALMAKLAGQDINTVR